MINYVKINAVLPRISSAIRQEDTNMNLLSYALQAYDLIASPVHKIEEPRMYTVKDHKVELGDDVIQVNLATFMLNEPTESDCNELASTLNIQSGVAQEEYNLTDSTNPCAGNYAIAHKLFLTTNYYNNNFYPMKYIGTSKYACKSCLSRFCHDCGETFSIDENKVLWTSFKDGTVCLFESKVMKDEDGDYLIIDDEDVIKYLALYAELEHFRNRMYSHEQGAIRIVNSLESKVNIWYNKARSTIKKILLNPQLIGEITVNSKNNNFWRHLPDLYRDKTELNLFYK